MYAYEQEAIKKFGNTYKRSSDSEYIFPCPNCKKNVKSDKLYVNLKNGVYHCFRCGYKGKLRGKYSLNNVFLKKENNQLNLDEETYLIPFHYIPLSREQKLALFNRGLTEDDIKFYHICGGKRIQIPNTVIGNLSDMICMWEWRKENVTETNPKYLYTNDVKKSKVLFNIQNIKQNADSIILCEGIFNAITAGRNAVASYGCELSDYQLKLILAKNPEKLIIAYDPDEAGVKGSTKAILKLKNSNYRGKVYYILLPKGKDINDLGKEKFREYFNENRVKINLDSKLSYKIPMMLFYNSV